MYRREKILREDRYCQERKTPSFSSTLLDKIYRSIDEGEKSTEELKFYRETMGKKQSRASGKSSRALEEEGTASLHGAYLIKKWMDKTARAKSLYKYGARKFAVFGLQSACGSGTTSSTCVDNINNVIELFNVELKSHVVALNHNLSGASFIFINTTRIGLTSPFLASLVSNVSCCEALSTIGLCVPFGRTCSNRSEYALYDSIHPTEIVISVFAGRAYKAQSPSDAYPFDISHLAQH